MTSLSDLTQLWSPDRLADVAVRSADGDEMRYGDLQARIERAATGLGAKGVRPGDVVGIALPNGPEFLVAFLAVTWARAVAAPFNPAYKVEEFRYYLEDAGATAVIVPAEAHPARDAAAMLGLPQWTLDDVQDSGAGTNRALDAPRPDDVALFLHTSGTTSRPKGVPLTHGGLMASIGNIAATYELAPDDVTAVVMPLFHVHGLVGATLSTLSSGGAVVLPSRFSASTFWAEADATRITWYSAVPTIHQILLQRDDGPAQPLRFIRSCSSALAPAVFHALEARFDAPVLEAYGMTEASHQVTSNPVPPGAWKAGSVGRGTGVDVSIINGEVCIRGANVMTGYVNNPEANAEAFIDDPTAADGGAGWFRTGDQGSLDGDGYLTLTGRIKELINRGGEKISPLEIDAVLLEHPAVAEAVTFGVPDAKYGEEVHAVVVAHGDDVDVVEVQRFCADRLADFKVPKRIHVADAVPRTATGKVQRRNVAADFTEATP